MIKKLYRCIKFCILFSLFGVHQVIVCSVPTHAASLISDSFGTGPDGFSYGDDQFRSTSQPAYASGVYDAGGGETDGGLQVSVGGIDGEDIVNGMSGGWSKGFSLSDNATVTISFDYRMIFSGTYDPIPLYFSFEKAMSYLFSIIRI